MVPRVVMLHNKILRLCVTKKGRLDPPVGLLTIFLPIIRDFTEAPLKNPEGPLVEKAGLD